MPNIKIQNFLGDGLDNNFGDYLSGLNVENEGKDFFLERKKILLDIINEDILRILGNKITIEDINMPLNTTDHMGIIHHRSPLTTIISDILGKNNPEKYISFPGGRISLNNFTEPFLISVNNKLIDVFGYYSQKKKNYIISSLPVLDVNEKNLNDLLSNIENIENKNKVRNIFLGENISNKDKYFSFVDQCVFINDQLFKILTNQNNNYIFLDKYDISRKYLIYLLENKDNVISLFLSSQDLLNLFCKTSLTGDSSDLFWLIEDHKQKQLKLSGTVLYYQDREILNLKDIENLLLKLRNNELILSLPFMYIIFSFYCGIDCLGGIRQVYYLDEIKKSWFSILTIIEDKLELEKESLINSNKLIGGFETIKKYKSLFDYISSNHILNIDELSNILANSTVRDFI